MNTSSLVATESEENPDTELGDCPRKPYGGVEVVLLAVDRGRE
jgi:hypothetical protein